MRGIGWFFPGGPPAVQSWPVSLRDAAIVVILCAAVASTVNVIREDGIPFIQEQDYQILVPCPETMGKADAAAPDALEALSNDILVVDARSEEAFQQWHVEGAISIPFDYLEPTSPDLIRRIATSGTREVLVYGDGHDPDSGEQLARELSGKGIRNLRFVSGGAPAIMAVRKRGTEP